VIHCGITSSVAACYGNRSLINGNRPPCRILEFPLPYQLFSGIDRYTLSEMLLRIHTLRRAVAAGLSVWLAVLACLMGCTLPSLTHAGSGTGPTAHENSAEPHSSDLMAGMENCPHHHLGGSAPLKPNDGKPVRGDGMSCCPVEVTVAAKPEISKARIILAQDFVSLSKVDLVTIRFYRGAENVPLVPHGGRDILLATQLLRI
jgi:hypothetical protein